MVLMKFCAYGDFLITFAKGSDNFFAVSALNFCVIILSLLHVLLAVFHPSVKGGRVQTSCTAAFDPCEHFLVHIGELIVAPSWQHPRVYELLGLEELLLGEPLLTTHPPPSPAAFTLHPPVEPGAYCNADPPPPPTPASASRDVLRLLLLLSTLQRWDFETGLHDHRKRLGGGVLGPTHVVPRSPEAASPPACCARSSELSRRRAMGHRVPPPLRPLLLCRLGRQVDFWNACHPDGLVPGFAVIEVPVGDVPSRFVPAPRVHVKISVVPSLPLALVDCCDCKIYPPAEPTRSDSFPPNPGN